MIYLDTNVILDILDEKSEKQDACKNALNDALALGPVAVSDTVYAETSIGMGSIEELDEVLGSLNITRTPPKQSALFLAGRAFLRYKRDEGGTKNNVLPDFFIGAQALDEGSPLVTSDTKRMSFYFEGLEIIAPN